MLNFSHLLRYFYYKLERSYRPRSERVTYKRRRFLLKLGLATFFICQVFFAAPLWAATLGTLCIGAADHGFPTEIEYMDKAEKQHTLTRLALAEFLAKHGSDMKSLDTKDRFENIVNGDFEAYQALKNDRAKVRCSLSL